MRKVHGAFRDTTSPPFGIWQEPAGKQYPTSTAPNRRETSRLHTPPMHHPGSSWGRSINGSRRAVPRVDAPSSTRASSPARRDGLSTNSVPSVSIVSKQRGGRNERGDGLVQVEFSPGLFSSRWDRAGIDGGMLEPEFETCSGEGSVDFHVRVD